LRSVREELAFVLDVSGSMSETYDLRWSKLDAAKRAVITLLLERSRISPQDQLALVSFDDHAQVEFPLSTLATDKAQMIQAIQALQIRGGTDINAGLKEAGSLFDFCYNAKRRIILLTDGQGGHPLRTAEGLKSQGVMIECIGIGQSPTCVDEALLRQVATTSNGECHYRFITDQRTLIDHVTRLGAQP
jgi:Ca-activated chloride channel family protein